MTGQISPLTLYNRLFFILHSQHFYEFPILANCLSATSVTHNVFFCRCNIITKYCACSVAQGALRVLIVHTAHLFSNLLVVFSLVITLAIYILKINFLTRSFKTYRSDLLTLILTLVDYCSGTTSDLVSRILSPTPTFTCI